MQAIKIDPDSKDPELQTYIDQFETFLDATDVSRANAEKCRDYKDHKQWTDEEEKALKDRGQAAVVNNRVGPKVKFMVGEQQRRRRNPKAYPRTPGHEGAADACTDAIRYVCDNNDFKNLSSDVFENEIVEGIGGCIIEVEDNNGEPEIVHNYIPWDRYYYDPHARAKDFSDKKYDGIVLWLDKEDVIEMFPDMKNQIDYLLSAASARTEEETFDDRPLWIDRKRKRIKVCQHFCLKDGEWYVTYFTDGAFLMEPKPSPYLDENGKPENPIVTQSAFIDRDNNRYGEVLGYIHMQDEINHRHSKYLHFLSTRQTWSTGGVVKDANKVKSELSKPNGHVEFEHGEWNKDFGTFPTNDMAEGQYRLLREAKDDIDALSVNAALSGKEDRNLSGRALIAKQEGGLTELGPLYDGHKSWELRVYRQTWNRIKQFWTKDKWIRVTDDERNLKWVGLNQPMTYGQMLQEKLEDPQTPPEHKEMAVALLESGDPRLNQVAEVKNNVAEIDVDIIIEDGEDSITVQQEQFNMMASLAQAYGPQEVPFKVMLELSSMTNKDRVMDLLQGGGDENPEADQLRQQLEQVIQQSQQAIAQLSQELEMIKQDRSLEAGKLQIEGQKAADDAEIKRLGQQLKAQELALREQELELKAVEASNPDKDLIKKYEIDVNAATELQKANIESETRIQEAALTNPPQEPQDPQPIYINTGGNKRIDLIRDSNGNATGATVVEE